LRKTKDKIKNNLCYNDQALDIEYLFCCSFPK